MVSGKNIAAYPIAAANLLAHHIGWSWALKLVIALLVVLTIGGSWVPNARAECHEDSPHTTNSDCEPLDPALLHRKTDLPPQLSVLSSTRTPIPETLVPYTYGRVIHADVPVYGDPSDPDNGIAPKRILGIGLGVGFMFVSVERWVSHNDVGWYRINAGEFVRDEHISIVAPSEFSGVQFDEPLQTPVAFMVSNFAPRLSPGGEVNESVPGLKRYDVVQVYATQQHTDGWNWYLIGTNQWIEQRSVGLVETKPKPAGVVGDRWVEVDLYEQTVAIYENGEIIYATLASTGMSDWYTRPGIFQIYAKLNADGMSGAYDADRRDYYYLEQVPWTMYFDKAIALHGAYWHNGFGYKRSHGCVNLSPTDAQWLFNWAEEGTYVWVHDPSGQTPGY